MSAAVQPIDIKDPQTILNYTGEELRLATGTLPVTGTAHLHHIIAPGWNVPQVDVTDSLLVAKLTHTEIIGLPDKVLPSVLLVVPTDVWLMNLLDREHARADLLCYLTEKDGHLLVTVG